MKLVKSPRKCSKVSLLYFAILAYLVIPQYILIIPALGDYVKVTDILSVVLLITLAFTYSKSLFIEPVLKVAVLFYTFCLLSLFLNTFINNRFDIVEPYLYLVRSLLMLVPLMFIVRVDGIANAYEKLGTIVCISSLFSIISIMVLYVCGFPWFDAHQTFFFGTDESSRFNRLGGLTKESGAFAFNVAFICELSLYFAYLRFSSFSTKALIFLFVSVVVFSAYMLSLSRAILFNWLIFAAAIFIFSSYFSLRSKVFGVSGAIILAIPLYDDILNLFASIEHFSRVFSMLSGEQDLNSLTSGRMDHWTNAFSIWSDNIFYVLFGIGHGASYSIFGHALENFFVMVVIMYGLVGFSIVAIMIFVMIWPICRASIKGDQPSKIMFAIAFASFCQAQINDINTYYQTFPVLLFFLVFHRYRVASILQT